MERVKFSNPIIKQYKFRTRRKEFIGGNPATLEAKDVCNIWNKMYNITPKVDGVRYLCIMDSMNGDSKIKARKTPYFIDRGGNQNYIRVYQPRHTNGNTPLPREFPPCILDGELVQEKIKTQKRTRQIYWIFDILSFNGQMVTHLSFNQRQDIINQELKKYLTLNASPDTWFFMLPKPYYNPTKFASSRDPYSKISTTFAEHCANLKLGKPVLDGLVINDTIRPYVSGVWKRCDNVQYKWKPRDKQTIDVTLTARDMPGGRKGDSLSFVLIHPKSRGKELAFTFEKPEELPDPKDRPKKKRAAAKGGGFKDEPLVAELVITGVSRKTKKITTKFERFREDKQANAYKTMASVINGFLYPVELRDLFGRDPKKALKYFTKRQLARVIHFGDVFNSKTLGSIRTMCKPSSAQAKIVVSFPGKGDVFDCVAERGFPSAKIRELTSPQGEFVLLADDRVRIPKHNGEKMGWRPADKQLDIDTRYLYNTPVNVTRMTLKKTTGPSSSKTSIVEKTIFRVTGYTNIIFENNNKDKPSFYLETFPGEDPSELIRIVRMILQL